MTTRSWMQGKSVLITGGTGSLGKTIAKKLLQEGDCAKVIIFSRDELKQWEMGQTDPIFNDGKIRYFLGNVRDEARLKRAFRGVHYVIHAAALKQVPAAEYNPSEFVQTNVNGAMNIINAAIDSGVERVVAVSTDKAVNPINLYGATKLCSDKLFIHGNVYAGANGCPKFAVARYGNVLGSRGSIIPLWRKMLEQGVKSLPITDPRMTRFWITLDQAAEFVLQCLGRMVGGEIFVPKIPSMKICDLADAIAPTIPKNIVGIREGEKVHELMISSEDARRCYEFEGHYVILPDTKYGNPAWDAIRKSGKAVKPEFCYASNTNTQWLDIPALSKIVDTIGKEPAPATSFKPPAQAIPLKLSR